MEYWQDRLHLEWTDLKPEILKEVLEFYKCDSIHDLQCTYLSILETPDEIRKTF
jgi:hypothetical protein